MNSLIIDIQFFTITFVLSYLVNIYSWNIFKKFFDHNPPEFLVLIIMVINFALSLLLGCLTFIMLAGTNVFTIKY